MSILDNTKLDITCPECNKNQSLTIKTLKSNRYKCTSCKAIFNAKAFNSEISKIESQLKKMGFR